MLPIIRRNQNWLPSILNDLLDENMAQPYFSSKNFISPATNIIESDKMYQIELATPGMAKEDFSVTLENENELVISLQKKDETLDKDEKNGNAKRYHRHEFSYQSFCQSFTLADDIDLEGISAKMENGVLTIDLPKKEIVPAAPVSRQINIC